MIYSVTRATVTGALARRAPPAQAAASAVTDQRWAWQDPAAPATRTVFKPAGRLQAVDPARPAVAEGLLITERALTELQAEVSGQGARLLVVTIPTRSAPTAPTSSPPALRCRLPMPACATSSRASVPVWPTS